MFWILEFGDVGQADEILMVAGEHGYGCPLNFDDVSVLFSVHNH
jgi:hypothetical protein